MNTLRIPPALGLPSKVARTLVLGASLVSAAYATYFLLLFLLFVGMATYSKIDTGQEDRSVRRAHLVMHLRAQILAVTGLAGYPGAWSVYVDRTGAQVVAKGGATRVIPSPTGLDIPATPSMLGTMLNSNILVDRGVEGAVIRVGNPEDGCVEIFSRYNLARFLEGPVEYRIGDAGEWKAYDKDFVCPDKAYDHLWLRPAARVSP